MKHNNAASWRATGSLACAKPDDDLFDTDATLPGNPTASLCLPTGKFFDEALDIRDPEGGAITSAALELIAGIEQRKKKRRPIDAIHNRILVRKILANGLRCHFHRRPPVVAYLRRTGSYRTGPQWLNGRAIGRTVDLLVQVGLLTTFAGRVGRASTYKGTGRLYSLAADCGVTSHSLMRSCPEAWCRFRR